MAQALLEAGHHPDLLCGTSAGALNAAYLAADPTLAGVSALGRLWTGLRRAEVFPVRPWTIGAGLIGVRDHTVSNRPLRRWLAEHLPFHRLEGAALPLVVTVTDLQSGEAVMLSEGPALPALLATTAMPGIFPPVRIGARWFVDGGIVADTPVGVAAEAGATRIFVLPSVPSGPMARPRAAGDVLLRSIGVMIGRAHVAELAAWADRAEILVVPAPLVPGVSPFSFAKSAQLIEAGYQQATRWLRDGDGRPAAPPSSLGPSQGYEPERATAPGGLPLRAS
jgi:NTE family protein